MKKIKASQITDAVHKIYDEICCNVDKDARESLILAEQKETNPTAKFALKIMNENLNLAINRHMPACQDTGLAVIFLEIGRECYIDGNIEDAINLGVRKAYDKYFRKSALDPITGENTKDNTPAIIHYEIVEGDSLKISAMAKGFGSENMSKLFMLTPAAGIEGIKKAVIDTIKASGGCACPPVIVGVGIGGTMEKSAILSKKALLRKIGSRHTRKDIALIESELLESINDTNIGAQGLGGATTALDVFIETYPTHIAGLPVSINVQCHCSRHKSIIIEGEQYA